MIVHFESNAKKELEELNKHWDWSRVFEVWKERMSEFNLNLDALFLPVQMHDASEPQIKSMMLAWWEKNDITESHIICQRHFDHRGYGNELESISLSSGERTTLSHLWKHKSDLEMIAAILIAGSLFYRMGSSRGDYPENWPSHQTADFLDQLTYKKWSKSSKRRAWSGFCTSVLPYTNDDNHYKIDTMESLIRYIADEHALLFLNFQMMEINFGEKRDPIIGAALDAEYKNKQ
jgi:hypothetical protein